MSEDTVVLSTHSWYGKYAHVFRSDGRVVRSKVGPIVLDSRYGVSLSVSFQSKRKRQRKRVSPISVAALQVLWLNVDVVSDVDLSDDPMMDEDFVPPPECERLPDLQIVEPPSEFAEACRAVEMQTNSFLQIKNGTTVI